MGWGDGEGRERLGRKMVEKKWNDKGDEESSRQAEQREEPAARRKMDRTGSTWRAQLGLAGRTGEGQALSEAVHPTEAQRQLSFRHGLQRLS